MSVPDRFALGMITQTHPLPWRYDEENNVIWDAENSVVGRFESESYASVFVDKHMTRLIVDWMNKN